MRVGIFPTVGRRLGGAPLRCRSLGTASRVRKLLIANRGEIALRISRAASELDISTVSVATAADAASLHAASADEVVGVESYTDASAIIRAATDAGCDAIHPGYGFLSESAAFARSCEAAGVTFVGPTAEALEALGDKVAARRLAVQAGVPVARASHAPCASGEEVRAAMARDGLQFPVMLKAVGGGGGRGMRPVRAASELDAAFATCAREVEAIGAAGGVFVEELLEGARHVEVRSPTISLRSPTRSDDLPRSPAPRRGARAWPPDDALMPRWAAAQLLLERRCSCLVIASDCFGLLRIASDRFGLLLERRCSCLVTATAASCTSSSESARYSAGGRS